MSYTKKRNTNNTPWLIEELDIDMDHQEDDPISDEEMAEIVKDIEEIEIEDEDGRLLERHVECDTSDIPDITFVFRKEEEEDVVIPRISDIFSHSTRPLGFNY